MKGMKYLVPLLIALMMIMSVPFAASAATSAPGKTKVVSVKAQSAPQKVGKGTVTVKWAKKKGASGYQVYLKRVDGSWKLAKTVSAKKASVNLKAYVGKNYVKVRAFKKSGGKKICGPFSKAKSFKVGSKLTLQKYMNAHPSEKKGIVSDAAEQGVKLLFRDNDLIYNYDLANNVDDERQITADFKKQLKKKLSKTDEFDKVIKAVESSYGLGGVRVLVKYVYNSTPVVMKAFN